MHIVLNYRLIFMSKNELRALEICMFLDKLEKNSSE